MKCGEVKLMVGVGGVTGIHAFPLCVRTPYRPSPNHY